MWFEDLPKDCPCKKATTPNKEKFYRMIQKKKPSCKDFWSFRKLRPQKPYPGLTECRVRSVSLNKSIENLEDLRKLSLHRNKHICEIELNYNDGKIKQTGKEGHYSWWRSKTFNPDGWSLSND